MKKSMRRTSHLNKAQTVVSRRWTTLEEHLRRLRFRPMATASDDEGYFNPFALLEKTYIPGTESAGTWQWIEQPDPIACQVIPESFALQAGNITEIMSFKGSTFDPPLAQVNYLLGNMEGLRPWV